MDGGKKKRGFNDKVGMGRWIADDGLKGNEPMAAITDGQMEKVKKELLWQHGDKIFVHIQRGNKKFMFPVKATYKEDEEKSLVTLSPEAAIQMKGARAKKAETEGNDNIRFYVERAKR